MTFAYGLLIVLHIASIAVAFGAIATQPLALRTVRGESPGSAAALIRAQRRIGNAVIVPAATLALITGAVLATVGGYWGELWVSLPLSLLVFVLSLHGAFVGPTQRRLEVLALGAVGAPREGGAIAYDSVARRLAASSHLSSLAIVLALALMVLKP